MNITHLTRWGMITVATIVVSVGLTERTAAQGPKLSRDAVKSLVALQLHSPVRGPINSAFGARRSLGGMGGVHTGVDIGARTGTPVRAPARGVVAFAGWQNGYGRTIILEHGHGIQTLYGHLSKFAVKRGQRVEQGATIGLVGTSGHTSGPHLHYEVRVDGQPVNPGGLGSTVVATRSGRAPGAVAATATTMAP